MNRWLWFWKKVMNRMTVNGVSWSFKACFCLQNVPGRSNKVFESRKGFQLCWKVDFRFDFCLSFFGIGLAVSGMLWSWILYGLLAYVCVNGIKWHLGALNLCHYVLDFVWPPLKNIPFLVQQPWFWCTKIACTNLAASKCFMKAIQTTRYHLINFFDFIWIIMD